MNEKPRALLGRILGEAVLSSFLTEVIHTQNFTRTREHLQRGGKAVIYTNHIHRFDSEPIAKTIMQYVAPLDEHAYVMIAMQYRDPDREENAAIVKAMNLMQGMFGFNFLPMVQDKPEEKARYKKWRRINKDSFDKAVTVLQEEPGGIVCVTPEGTRSTTGALLEAKTGFEKLLERGGDAVIIQPMALVHAQIKPLTMRTRIIVPEPFTYGEVKAEQDANPDFSVTGLAMLKIARELPPQNQGPYAEMLASYNS